MQVKFWLLLDELKCPERLEKNVLRAKRMRIVILACEGSTAAAIDMAVGLSRRVCQQWVARYHAEGLVGLDDRRGQKSRISLTTEETEAFHERITSGATEEDSVCTLRGKDFQRILAAEFGQQRSPPIIPASVYEFTFKMNHASVNKERPPTCGRRKALVQRQFVKPSINICGASEWFVLRQVTPKDDTAKALEVRENVTLVQLPPYSPELNPIENLWHYLKSDYWSNRTYKDYDEIEDAAMKAWQQAVLNEDLMKTLSAAPYTKNANSD